MSLTVPETMSVLVCRCEYLIAGGWLSYPELEKFVFKF